MRFIIFLPVFFLLVSSSLFADGGGPEKLYPTIDQLAKEYNQEVIQLRRHFHEFPELSNREFKTSAKVAEELKALGLEIETGIAHTGVVAI